MSESEDNRRGRQWHLDRSLSVGHLMTTLTVVIAGMWFIAGQDQRIGLNTQAIQYNALRIERSESERQRDADRIDAKLDKIFEYLQEHQ